MCKLLNIQCQMIITDRISRRRHQSYRISNNSPTSISSGEMEGMQKKNKAPALPWFRNFLLLLVFFKSVPFKCLFDIFIERTKLTYSHKKRNIHFLNYANYNINALRHSGKNRKLATINDRFTTYKELKEYCHNCHMLRGLQKIK